MNRKWKSLILSANWILISVATTIIIIFTQPKDIVSAQEPAVIIRTEKKSPVETAEDKQNPEINTESESESDSDSNANINDKDKLEEISEDVSDEIKKPEGSSDTNDQKQSEEKSEETKLSPEEIARQNKLIAADKLYLSGEIAAAEKLYKQAKKPFTTATTAKERKEAITEIDKLSPAGKVYWRESTAGITNNLETRTLVPLKLLVEQYPEFIPGHIRYAQALEKYDREKTALKILERATTLYPNQPNLVEERIKALGEAKKWMEASLAARQFAILNPKHPQAKEFRLSADENLKRYKRHIKREIRGNAIANVITGALGYAVTGSLLGPFSALDSTLLLLKGERAIGESVAKRAKKKEKLLVKDEAINNYINEIGQKLAKVTGRDEFKYEFFVIPDENLNAFALPGGKIFLHAGAIAKTNSEAEIAGLIGHELAHTVLSHGFQLVTQGNLISNVTQYLPLGGTVGQILTFNYSRRMEKQADILGTRMIAASGYAADGLRNLMVTLEKEQKRKPPKWLSSHPGGSDRVDYLEEMITQSSYNRYVYEGVEKHLEIQKIAKQILKEEKEKKKDRKDEKEEKRKKTEENESKK
ncbi:MAG: M48 family metalloprotease [Cyanobacteria bacterium P01_A01_bin.84]